MLSVCSGLRTTLFGKLNKMLLPLNFSAEVTCGYGEKDAVLRRQWVCKL